MKRSLIINADDLGLSEEVNSGILFALQQGLISDASLLAKAPFATEAAKGLKDLGVQHTGVHINLDELFGWKPGGIELKPRSVLLESLNDPGFIGECAHEAKEQIRLFLSYGLIPSHLDTHHHVHGFLPIFQMLVNVLGEFGIPAMRFSRHGYHLPTRQGIPFDEAAYSRMDELLRLNGVFTTSQCLEGAEKVSQVAEGITELVVHPSLGGDSWRVQELDVLQAQTGIERLGCAGISLMSFREARESQGLTS